MFNKISTRALPLLFALLWTGSGCGGSQKPLREIPEEALGAIAVEIDTYEGKGTAEQITGNTQKYEKLAKAFRGALDKQSHPFVKHDPALDIIAMLQLHSFGGNEALAARSLARWMMWKLGVSGTYIGTFAWAGSGRTIKKQLTAAMRSSGRDFDAKGKHYSYGVARLKIGGNSYAQALVWVKKNVLLYDLPKHYAAGEEILVRGKILVPFEDPELFMDMDPREVFETDIDADEEGKFALKVNAPTTPGRHFIEILISDPEGEDTREQDRYWQRAILMLPIYVDVPEPSAPDEMIRKPPENPPDERQWPSRFIELYNRERIDVGLPPLKLHPAATKLAREQAARHIADESTIDDSELKKILKKEGIVVDNALQARGYVQYVDERAWLHLLSPSHRQRIFNKNTTLFGIDFVNDEPYSYGYYEYLITVADPVEQAEVAKLLDEIETVLADAEKGSAKTNPLAEEAMKLLDSLEDYNVAAENRERYFLLLVRVLDLMKQPARPGENPTVPETDTAKPTAPTPRAVSD